jgi:hypothetical protein
LVQSGLLETSSSVSLVIDSRVIRLSSGAMRSIAIPAPNPPVPELLISPASSTPRARPNHHYTTLQLRYPHTSFFFLRTQSIPLRIRKSMLDTTVLLAAFLLASAFTLLLAAMLYPSALLRWFQRKRYQYEVTFSLYMLTSTEKFIFSTLAPLTCRRMQNRILSCFLECGDSPPLSSLSLSLSLCERHTASAHTHTYSASSTCLQI